jgi:hypothetical protein
VIVAGLVVFGGVETYLALTDNSAALERQAYQACSKHVLDNLAGGDATAPSYSQDNMRIVQLEDGDRPVYRVRSFVETERVTGETERRRYQCQVLLSGDNAVVQSAKFDS